MLQINNKGSFLIFIKDKPKDLLEKLHLIKQILNNGSRQHGIPAQCKDFKICINQFQYGWQMKITSGIRPYGPVNASKCMSCDFECPLIIGLLGDDIVHFSVSTHHHLI